MGIYLNPGNEGFAVIRSSTYVDKSGLIALINDTINTKQKLICVSRPRRFGKSYAAQMLCAYYDKTCDSSALFEDLKIASGEEFNRDYEKYRNKYDVIYLDMTNILGKVGSVNIIPFIEKQVTEELLNEYPELTEGRAFDDTLINTVTLTGNKFVMIMDEWDAPIRENPAIQKEYLHFLRTLFKSSGTTDKIFAAAYMTGILPIKKDGSQSAISDFQEFTMLNPWKFAEYVGFTEAEVKSLCEQYGGDFSRMKQWYDGYALEDAGSVYNPNSVMSALRYGKYRSYWTETSAASSLMGYIGMDFDGLSRTIAELLGGVEAAVDTNGFANDLVTFRGRDDVLTLLIHLGYLAYNEDTGRAHIPNEEIRLEFAKSIRTVKRDETIRRVRESDQLILDTVEQREEAVAAQIEKIHAEETAPLFYNNEQSLRSVIKLAYFSYKDQYMKFEELPGGTGYADIVYFPKKDSPLPVLVVELKWNQSAEGAIEQIRQKNYPDALKDYGGEILLVGIAYDKNAPAGQRKHSCRIERV